MGKYYKIFLVLLVPVLLLSACSSQKRGSSKHNPTWLKFRYHDLTARDNGYFNAKLRLNTAFKKLQEEQKDNYEEILPVFEYGDEDAGNALSSDMDDVIKKASLVIQLHPMSKWIDDSYFSIGQANFIKRDYEPAINTFQYVVKTYEGKIRKVKQSKKKKKRRGSVRKGKKKKKGSSAKKKRKKKSVSAKKRKKLKKKAAAAKRAAASKSNSTSTTDKGSKNSKDGKGKKGKGKGKDKEDGEDDDDKKKKFLNFLRHKSARDVSLVWLIKSYIEAEKFTEAEVLLALARSDKNFDKRLKDDLEAVEAHYFLKQGDIAGAIAPLERAVELTRKKRKRARYVFILAQIEHNLGNKSAAKAHYENVLKLNPDYEMQFYAKINLARNFQSGAGGAGEVRRILKKMARTEKYIEFRDQVYYTLAELSLKDNDEQGAIKYLKKSVASSKDNKEQKAKSYLLLAKIYYDNEEYVLSQPYYDSTLKVIDKKYPDYWDIFDRNEILTEVVERILIIEEQDSLQTIAKLSKKDLNDFVDDIIAQQEREEEKANFKQKGQSGPMSKAAFEESARSAGLDKPGSQTTKSNWYFYNHSAISQGYGEFKKRWGERALTDNWRQSNKTVLSLDQLEAEGSELTTLAEMSRDREKTAILEALPLTEDGLEVSNDKIIFAMFELGGLYQVKLKNDPQAIRTFEDLLRRYPKNRYEEQSYYSLYLLYKKNGPANKATFYKNKLLNDFPEGLFANIIRDPTYITQAEADERKLLRFYEVTYNMFRGKKYHDVIMRKDQAIKDYPDNHLQPRFDLLAAISMGATRDKNTYMASLKQVISDYPEHEVKIKAEELLKYLKDGEKRAKQKDPMSKYKFTERTPHYVAIMITSTNSRAANKVSGGISNYNTSQHSIDGLKVSKMLYEKSSQLILVKQFPTSSKAISYEDELNGNKTIFAGLKPEEYQIFSIAKQNFTLFYKGKDLKGYLEFYNSTYR